MKESGRKKGPRTKEYEGLMYCGRIDVKKYGRFQGRQATILRTCRSLRRNWTANAR